MNRSCKHYPYLLLLLLGSCITAPESYVNTKFDPTEKISPISEISAEEKIIATRICYAYESKENNFYSPDYLEKHFDFETSIKGCGQSENNKLSSGLKRLDDGKYIFTTNQVGFFTAVQSVSNGYISKLCASIKDNKSISNTVSIGDKLIQVHFFKDNLDSYILKYFSKGLSDNYSPVLFETFKVRTHFNRKNVQILGMDVLYESQKKCEEGPETLIYSQNFID